MIEDTNEIMNKVAKDEEVVTTSEVMSNPMLAQEVIGAAIDSFKKNAAEMGASYSDEEVALAVGELFMHLSDEKDLILSKLKSAGNVGESRRRIKKYVG